jgi:outer membrane protein TolC
VRGRVREAQAGLESDRQLLESERLRISLEVRQAYLDLQEARARIHVARKEQDAAREALRVAQVRYSAGLGTSVEVTDAQVALARAGQNLADARYDELASAARLEAATGTRRPDAGSRTGP